MSRVRAQDANGDMTFGQNQANFLIDNVQMVQQKILTRLKLWQGEFFLNTSAGMPWQTEVIGYGTEALYDAAIQAQIQGTVAVTEISSYSSNLDPATRVLTVTFTVQTLYGPLTVSANLPFAPPATSGFGAGGFGVNPFGV